MSKNLQIMDMKGSPAGEYEVSDDLLEFEKGSQAVHDAVVAFNAEQRAGTASTKTRSEVSGGGAKPWRQKGTGRARAGSNRSPIWRKGGITFGPKPRSYAKRMNKKVAKLALKRAFSERVGENAVVVIDSLQVPDHKTRNLRILLKNMKFSKSVMLVAEADKNIDLASGNIMELMYETSGSVNVYKLLLPEKIIFTKDALEKFLKRIAEGGK